MSLLKPCVLTPARLQPNRLNAQKSTGPRTALGKASSRLNSMRNGCCSPKYNQRWYALFECRPDYSVEYIVHQLLTPPEILNPVFSNLIELHCELEREDPEYSRLLKRRKARKARRDIKRSQEAIENNSLGESQKAESWELIENRRLNLNTPSSTRKWATYLQKTASKRCRRPLDLMHHSRKVLFSTPNAPNLGD